MATGGCGRRMVLRVLLVIGAFAGTPGLVGAWQSPAFDEETLQAIELENAVLEARRRITSFEAVVKHGSARGRSACKLICDGPNLRFDYGSSVVVKTDDRIITRKSPGEQPEGVRRIVGEIRPLDWEGKRILDPRQLGICMGKAQNHHFNEGFTSTLGFRDRVRSTLTREQKDGRELSHIQTTCLNEMTTDVWIDEQRGPSATRIEFHATHKDRLIHDRLDVELAQADGEWFPAKVTYRRATNPLFWHPEDTIELSEIRINQGIDYKLFTPAGMGFQPGDRLYDGLEKGPRTPWPTWNGTELVWPPGDEKL